MILCFLKEVAGTVQFEIAERGKWRRIPGSWRLAPWKWRMSQHGGRFESFVRIVQLHHAVEPLTAMQRSDTLPTGNAADAGQPSRPRKAPSAILYAYSANRIDSLTPDALCCPRNFAYRGRTSEEISFVETRRFLCPHFLPPETEGEGRLITGHSAGFPRITDLLPVILTSLITT